jgi:hypothetical protein
MFAEFEFKSSPGLAAGLLGAAGFPGTVNSDSFPKNGCAGGGIVSEGDVETLPEAGIAAECCWRPYPIAAKAHKRRHGGTGRAQMGNLEKLSRLTKVL